MHTQNVYASSPSNLLHHHFITFLQDMFLGLQNLDGSIMHNIDDISQLLGMLKWAMNLRNLGEPNLTRTGR